MPLAFWVWTGHDGRCTGVEKPGEVYTLFFLPCGLTVAKNGIAREAQPRIPGFTRLKGGAKGRLAQRISLYAVRAGGRLTGRYEFHTDLPPDPG